MQKPNFEHVWKNMYLVRNFEGVREAAQHVSRNKNVHLNNTYSMDGKYPLIVVLTGTHNHQHVSMPLTDTTLKFCLAKLEDA